MSIALFLWISCDDDRPFAQILCGNLFNHLNTISLDSGAACSLINSSLVPNDVSLYDTYNERPNVISGNSMDVEVKLPL